MKENNPSRFLTRQIEHTAKRGLRPEELRLLKAAEKAAKQEALAAK